MSTPMRRDQSGRSAATPSRTTIPWSAERKDQLRRLWSESRSSGEIASALGGVTRNAVMGMVNRLGLMGKGGSKTQSSRPVVATRAVGRPPVADRHDPDLIARTFGPGAGPSLAAARLLVAEAFGMPYDPARAGHAEAYVAIGAAMATCDAEILSPLLDLPSERIEDILARFDRFDIWKCGDPIPETWLDETYGDTALVLDSLIVAGIIRSPQGTARRRNAMSDAA